jgi:hypothetical protein
VVASLALLKVLKVENGHFVQPRDYGLRPYRLLTARATQRVAVNQFLGAYALPLLPLGRANPFENAKVHFCRSFATSLNALNGALNGLNVHLCRCSLNDLNGVNLTERLGLK